MTTLPDDALRKPQHEVQRLLGRCLLRLQQYERLIKVIIASHKISGTAQTLETLQAKRIADTAGKTLGTLVGNLLESYVVSNKIDPPAETATSSPEDVTSFAVRLYQELSDADFARTKNELKELVLLRNDLVHHFIDQHDLWSLNGCRGARDALVAAYSRIDQHFEQLRGWAEDLQQYRRLAAEFVQSDAFRDLVVNGIAPDGTVDWLVAGVVNTLREAEGELAVDGWAPVTEAGMWIEERHPEQRPAKYGCSSWRQVVHETRIFELRYREIEGKRAAWYREKESSPKSH
jgi:hypothetical protein